VGNWRGDSGNEIGLSLPQWQKLSPVKQKSLRVRVYEKLNSAGAHYVIDSISGVITVLEDIQKRLQRGEKP
jgi:phosphonoacetaldehyde hydrolase